MEMIRHFWDVAVAVRSGDAKLAQGERFPICHPERLAALWQSLGLGSVATTAIDISTVFQDFADYWNPLPRKTGHGAPVARVARLRRHGIGFETSWHRASFRHLAGQSLSRRVPGRCTASSESPCDAHRPSRRSGEAP
jgi:hypothetical protein